MIYGGPGWIYSSLFLLLAGMQSPGAAPRFLRWLAAGTFLGAGLYHLLDPDWRSGEFFEHWTQARPDRRLYAAAASWFPPAFLSKLTAWSTITACLGLAAGFSLRRLYPAHSAYVMYAAR